MSVNDRKVNLIITFLVIVVVLIILAKTGSFFIQGYNNLVRLQENVNLAESEVKNMMQRQLELIPNLVEIVKAEIRHDEKALEDITNTVDALKDILESASTTDEIIAVDEEISKQINDLFEIAKANLTVKEQYSSLRAQVEGSVTRIALARKNYNIAATNYNTAIREVPNCIVAWICGFKQMDLFEADAEVSKIQIIEWDN